MPVCLPRAHVNVYTDRLLTEFSTSQYDKNELEYMLNVVKEIEAEGEGEALSGYLYVHSSSGHNSFPGRYSRE